MASFNIFIKRSRKKKDGFIQSLSSQMLLSDLLGHVHNNLATTNCKNTFYEHKYQPSFKMGHNELL